MEKKILVVFNTLAMSMVTKVIFDCTATIDHLLSRATLLEEYFALIGELETKLRNPAPPYLSI